MAMRFVWDPAKAKSNLRKHGVEFEDAADAFADPFAISKSDRIVDGELRWQTLGMERGLLLLVAHTLYEIEQVGSVVEIVRIISARIATRAERQRYEQEIR